jgi:putative polyhydroxyalkanoate system protein
MLSRMPRLDITQPHHVTTEEARRRLEQFHAQLEQQYGLHPRWTSPTEVTIERSGANGTLAIEPDQIKVHIDLPFPFAPLKGRIEERIKRELGYLFDN